MFSELTTKAYIITTESLRNSVQSFKTNQQGVTAIEYGLIAVAIAGLVTTVFYDNGGFIEQLKNKFSDLGKVVKKQPLTGQI